MNLTLAVGNGIKSNKSESDECGIQHVSVPRLNLMDVPIRFKDNRSNHYCINSVVLKEYIHHLQLEYVFFNEGCELKENYTYWFDACFINKLDKVLEHHKAQATVRDPEKRKQRAAKLTNLGNQQLREAITFGYWLLWWCRRCIAGPNPVIKITPIKEYRL